MDAQDEVIRSSEWDRKSVVRRRGSLDNSWVKPWMEFPVQVTSVKVEPVYDGAMNSTKGVFVKPCHVEAVFTLGR